MVLSSVADRRCWLGVRRDAVAFLRPPQHHPAVGTGARAGQALLFLLPVNSSRAAAAPISLRRTRQSTWKRVCSWGEEDSE